MPVRPLVSVVDDDQSIRESLPDLLTELGFLAQTFASPEEFLQSPFLEHTKCLLLDIGMPGMSGYDLQHELMSRKSSIPIIFITGPRDEAVRVQLMQDGAIECLFKPFSEEALLIALAKAFQTE